MDKERYDGFCEGFGNADLMLIPMQKEERRRFYEEKLEILRSYSAVFAVSDYYALDLIQFLYEHGVSVPGEISVAGFDDTPMCNMVMPTLTSVRQDLALRAKIAMEKLTELREKRESEVSMKLPVTMVVRESTGSYTKK